MLCRKPSLNPPFYFDKTMEEYKKGFQANGMFLGFKDHHETLLYIGSLQVRFGLDLMLFTTLQPKPMALIS